MRTRRLEPAILLLILVAAVVLRFHAIGRASLWLDEIATVENAAGQGMGHDQIPHGVWISSPTDWTALGARPWHSAWTNVAGDVHPPLFYVVLRCWAMLTSTDAGLRTLTALLSLGALAATWAAVRRLHGPLAAGVAAALMAVAPLQIQVAQELRSYALLQLLGAVLLYVAAGAIRDGLTVGRAVGLAVTVAAMALTHHFFVGAALGVGVYLLIVSDRRRALAAAIGAIALYGLAWGPWLYQQATLLSHIDHLVPAAPLPFLRTLQLAAIFPARVAVNTAAPPPWWMLAPCVMWLVPALIRTRPAMLWWSYLAGALALAVAFDTLRPAVSLSLPKYAAVASPAVFALLGLLASTRPRVGVPFAAAIMVTAAVSYDSVYNEQQAWRAMAATVDAAASDRPIAIAYASAKPGDWQPRAAVPCLAYYSAAARRGPIAVVAGSPIPPPPDGFRDLWVLTPNSTPPAPPPGFTPAGAGKGFLHTGVLWHFTPTPPVTASRPALPTQP